jgi:hypothetical protein
MTSATTQHVHMPMQKVSRQSASTLVNIEGSACAAVLS